MVQRSSKSLFERLFQNPYKHLKGAGARFGRSPKTKGVPKPRILMDSLLVVGLLYCVYAHTTIGAVTERGVRTTMGQRNLPSLFDTFQGRDNRVTLESPHMSLDKTALLNNGHLLMISNRKGLPIRLLQAAVLAHGQCDKSSCQMKRPDFIEDLLLQNAQPRSSSLEPKSNVSIELYAEALVQASKKLRSNHEAAVEALYVGLHQVIHAIERAELAEMQQPQDVEIHASYFTPMLRRGPLQDAIVVLTHYRLLCLVWPMDTDHTITSPYGYRVHPILKTKRFHNGADLSAPAGTSVKAAHHGRVKRSAKDSISGRYVLLDHGFGIQTTILSFVEYYSRNESGCATESSPRTPRFNGTFDWSSLALHPTNCGQDCGSCELWLSKY